MRRFWHAAALIVIQLLFPFFAVAAAPVISSLTPNTGAVGSTIVIAGSNFGSTQANDTVTFNGTKATITSFSSTSIKATVPTGATTGNVVVTVSGVASNGVLFTVTPAPSISSLTPNTGAVGSSIVIAGSNFGPTQGTGKVTFNGTTATITTWSATQIVAKVPTGATTGNVVVTAAGGVASNGVTFTVTPAPSISSLVPNSGIIGAAVTINGSNFGPTQGNGKVTFNGTVAKINSWSATQITTSVPTGATTGSVVVTAAGGVASSGVSFTVTPPPSISSISPTSGATGTSVTINGSNFGSTQGSSTVAFNGAAATATSWSTTKLVVTVPAAATTGNVVVTVSTQASNGVAFTVLPHIATLSPTSQPIGDAFAINGTGFGTTQSSSTVTVGGISATATSWSTTQVVATVPSGAAIGSDAVVVKVGGNSSNSATLGVVAALSVTASASPKPNANGWNNTSVAISYTCSGGVQPVQCPASQTISTQGANQNITATAKDANGNTASASTILNIDETAPTITATVTPAANAKGVVTAPATVNFTCSDSLSGVATCPSPIQVTTVGLNESFSGTATDKAGNSATTTLTVSVQSAPLAIVATAAPQANANGWNNTNVTVSYTCSGGVPPLQCPGSQTVTVEGANQVVNASVTDAATQSASASTTVSIDKTPPTITASVSPVPNAQGVVTAPTTITFTCSDALSGVATCPAPIQATTVGLNESFSGTATDKAGNSASASVKISVESAPLSITATAAPQPNANGWNNTNVTVSYTCSGGVPPLQCPGSQTVSAEGANQIISATVSDSAGQSASTTTTVSIDKTPPTITASVSPVANAQGVVTAPATITFTCSDTLSGVATCPSPIQVTTVGLNESFSGTATDKAGNSASASVTISVQSSPLAIVATAAPQPNANGWNNTNVTVSYTCSGGVPPLQCPGSQTVSAEGANQIISATVSDAAGQSASTTTTVSIDKTPPTITASVSPVANAQGVVTAPATITFTCSDALSGVATCPSSIPITTVGLNESFSGTATDKAGNSASASVTISVQSSPLAIVATAAPQANANGWNNTAVTISYTCSGGVPPLHCPGPQTVSAEGANQVISASVTDAAGQSASTTTTLNIDRTPPTVTPIITPAPNAAGWNNSSVTVSFTCSDAVSGVTVCSSPIQVSTEGAGQSFCGSATDAAGNTGQGCVAVNIDKTPPIITATVAPVPNANGWNTTPVTVSFQCSDALSGIAICSPAQTVSAQGANQNISGTATDVAGNTATATVVVNLETSPPTITATAAPPANAAGWNNTPVTVTFQCTPSASPVTSCPQPQTVSTEGANQTASGTVTDVAGLSGSTSITLNIDETPPVISATVSPAPNANGIIFGPSATVSFTCSDALSGIATCPSPVTTTTQGSQTISGTAIDQAGNSASASIQFNLQNFPPLQVVPIVSPSPNAAGWNNSPVTVSFQCFGGAPPVNCPSPQTLNTDGAGQVVTGTATDSAGSSVSASATINLDQMPPVVSITSPADGSTTISATVAVQGTATDATSGVASAFCNGSPASVAGGSFTCTISGIVQGSFPVTVQVLDAAGNTGSAKVTITLVGPTLTITSPAPLDLFSSPSITVSGTVDDPAANVSVNGVAATNSGGTFTAQGVILREGNNLVTATGINAGGGVGTASVNVVLDTTPPIVRIDSPSDKAILTNPQIYVTGLVNDAVPGTVNPGQVIVTVNGVVAAVGNRSFMAEDVLLVPGQNVITAIAKDRAGNTSQHQITVTLTDAAAQQRILMVSGNAQTGAVGSILPQALVVEVVNSVGQPMPNVPITFSLAKSDGQLISFPQQGRQITIQSDGNGQASANLQLGTRMGNGNNQVLVTSPGFVGEIMFCASATVGPPAQIHDISGSVQTGVAGQPVPEALVVGVVDAFGNPTPGVPVTFQISKGNGTVEGKVAVTKTTDGDGRTAAVLVVDIQGGINNNAVTASFAGLTGSPAAFIASSKLANDPAATRVSGVVLDDANEPLPNVTASIAGTNLSALTDSSGRFTITNAPVGSIELFIDGTTSTDSEPYPFLEFPMVTVAGQDNHLNGPIYLPSLDLDNAKVVGGDEDVTLTMKGVPGVAFTVFAHSATFPDGSHVGKLSVTQVHSDKVPMSPPNGTAPSLMWTIQPPRVKFDPPIREQIPNTAGLPPGTVTETFCYSHDLEQFVAGGTARVSEDGSVITTDPGFGGVVSGWGGAPPPPPPPTKPKKDPCEQAADDAQQLADQNQGFFNPTTEFMNVQACIAKNSCATKDNMDNPDWLDQVLPKFVNALKDQTGAWPAIIAACNALPLLNPLRKQECAAMMAMNHIFVDLFGAMVQVGCGDDHDWQQVEDIIKQCLKNEDPLLSKIETPITLFMRNRVHDACRLVRSKLGLTPVDGAAPL